MFVTRAVRVIDLITNLDMSSFEAHSGLTAFINRLAYEVDECRKEQPFVIRVKAAAVVDQIEEQQSDRELSPAEMHVAPVAEADTESGRDVIGRFLVCFVGDLKLLSATFVICSCQLKTKKRII